jgi:hypothetical protein
MSKSNVSVAVSGRAPARTGRVADRTHGWDPVARGLFESIGGLVAALDATTELRSHAEADTGATKRSTTDMSIRIEFGQMLSFYHRQLNGPIITNKKDQNGRVIGTQEIPCAREMLRQSEEKAQKAREDLDNPDLSTTAQINVLAELEKQLYWQNVNEAKVQHYENMIGAISTVYREITNEDWVAPKNPKTENNLAKLPDDERVKRIEEAKASYQKKFGKVA